MNETVTEPKAVDVLVVEDKVGDARLIEMAFAKLSVRTRIHMVRNGVDAMDYLRREGRFQEAVRPDLVLLDLNLPKKDGRQVLKEIKKDAGLKGIPVLILSTSNWDKDVKEAYDSHANFYIVKALDWDTFMATMTYVEEVWLKKLLPGAGEGRGTAG